MLKSNFTAIAIYLMLGAIGARAEPSYFEGSAELRGDAMAIRLAIDPSDTTATLDIPQMWYAEEPIEARIMESGDVALSLPFGLGDFELARDGDAWTGANGNVTVTLGEGTAPPYYKLDMSFGAAHAQVEGTLYVPDGEGPFPAVIIIGGSGSGARDAWTYRSKADYYARLGVAAFIYDRREYDAPFFDGSLPDFWTHSADIAAARVAIAARPDISGDQIGLHGGSQGVWLSIIAQAVHGGFAFLVMTGVPAVSPGDQQIHSLIYGMRDDGVAEDVIADAVAYQRLYFAVAHTLEGWEALSAAMTAAEGSDWFQYVDQPQSLEDLDWWRRHHSYEPREDLIGITIPILAMTGSGDWITPPVENLPKLEFYGRLAGNEHLTTMILPRADHRLERNPYTDDEGLWHWFEIASEARAAIPAFLRDEVGVELTD